MSYTGLATGAGAAQGLETLLARLRAEEELSNQGRQVDINEFTSRSLDRDRSTTADQGQQRINEGISEFQQMAPTREANIAGMTANARAANTNADQGQEQLGVLRGLKPYFGGADANAGGSTGAGAGVAPDPNQLNNPLGRIRLSAAGLNPNEAFGPPNVDNTDEEQYLTAYAQKVLGAGKTGRDLTFDQRLEAMKQKPQTMIAQSNLNIRSSESKLRQQKWGLDIREAEMKLQQDEKIPPGMRPFMLAEFRNRMQNDVQSKQTWTQWWNGEEVADPSAQIAEVMADVLSKAAAGGYNAPAPVQGPVQPGQSTLPTPGQTTRPRFDRQGNRIVTPSP